MSKLFDVKFRHGVTSKELSISGEIPDEDWDRLITYADEVVQLENARPLQQDIRARITFKWDARTRKLCYEGTLPDDDDVAAILHRLRPFVLQNESANFYRTANILSRYLDHADARAMIKTQHDLYSGKDFQQQLKIDWKSQSLQAVVNSDETLTKWLNAYEYHRDRPKQQEIEEFHKLLPHGAPRAIFISMLLDKIKAIINVAIIIRTLERSDAVPLVYSF